MTMCDYSLEHIGTEPARQGERYVLTLFGTGSWGFTQRGLVAACVKPGSMLRLEGLQKHIQRHWQVDATEEVEFIQLNRTGHRDAVRFKNGKEALLQNLGYCDMTVLMPPAAQVEDHELATPAPVAPPMRRSIYVDRVLAMFRA